MASFDSTSGKDLLLVTPQRPGCMDGKGKRHSTPSREELSPKKIVTVVPSSILQPLQTLLPRSALLVSPVGWAMPITTGRIEARISIGDKPNTQVILQNARHVMVPFDLGEDENALRIDKNISLLQEVFPQLVMGATDGDFVYLHLTTPLQSPPLTVAGLPAIFSFGPEAMKNFAGYTSPNLAGFMVSYKKGHIKSDIDGPSMIRDDIYALFEIIQSCLEQQGVLFTEVIFGKRHVCIVLLNRDVNVQTLSTPWKICGLLCTYLFDDETGRPEAWQARRFTDPTPGNPDEAEYKTLQPGVRVSSQYLPGTSQYMSTTAGVLVRDGDGNKYMTVAAHGFPSGCGSKVMHPSPAQGREIGRIVKTIPILDLALVELDKKEVFRNVTFENDDFTAAQPLLQSEADMIDLRHHDPVYLDSPDTGSIAGIHVYTGFMKGMSESSNQDWILTKWLYMGQYVAQNLPAGICGSVIVTEDCSVAGFFRYASTDGPLSQLCCGIAAREIVKAGYTIVETETSTPQNAKFGVGFGMHMRVCSRPLHSCA